MTDDSHIISGGGWAGRMRAKRRRVEANNCRSLPFHGTGVK